MFLYKISFFVPCAQAEEVKLSMFNAGAGKIGNYDRCSFEVLGQGQFRALPGSAPFIGRLNEVEVVPELKVEMICADDKIKDVIAAMKKTHPYETPAYDVIRLENF